MKGILGVVIKPIAGLLDLGSSYTLGVRELLKQENLQYKMLRVWPLRVFCTKQQIL